jgi:hypothetical protein
MEEVCAAMERFAQPSSGAASDLMPRGSGKPMLRLGCGARCSHGTGAGRLIIDRGAVRFEFDKAARQRGVPPVLHARPPLIFVRARLLPPGLNSSLIVRGDDDAVTIVTWGGAMSRVKRALIDADVAFFDRVTWLSIGGHGGVAARQLPRGSAAE